MRRWHPAWVWLAALLSAATGCSGNTGLIGDGQRTQGTSNEPPFGTAGEAAAGTGGGDADAGGNADAGVDGGEEDTASSGDAGDSGQADSGGEPEPSCDPLPDPATFLESDVGGGGPQYVDSDHFRIYGNASASSTDTALNHLEAAHKCFVQDWCFRSPGLSLHSNDDGPYHRFNLYAVSSLGNAAGVMRYDANAGLSFLEVTINSLPQPRVVVHELGHSLTLTENGWNNQGRTGAWWETIANWVSDTYLTSRHCEAARNAFGVPEGDSIINLNRVIGESHLLIVSTQNYYQAWPLFTYLTNNPDRYPGLGRMAVPDMIRNHAGNNETPLHVLERLAAPVRVQTILGRYWARMAYLDIEHPRARKTFFDQRSTLNFSNLDPAGDETYQVKANRRPAYGGANIIPLSGSGPLSVQLTNLGNGLSDSNFTATLAVRSSDGSVRYVELPDGAGQTHIESGQEASLVVVNTPDTLYLYNAFQTEESSPEAAGLNYRVVIKGAVPSQ